MFSLSSPPPSAFFLLPPAAAEGVASSELKVYMFGVYAGGLVVPRTVRQNALTLAQTSPFEHVGIALHRRLVIFDFEMEYASYLSIVYC